MEINLEIFFYTEISSYLYSPLAQLVERLFYMQDVVGSIPAGTTLRGYRIAAIAGDCKSPDFGLRWFEST